MGLRHRLSVYVRYDVEAEDTEKAVEAAVARLDEPDECVVVLAPRKLGHLGWHRPGRWRDAVRAALGGDQATGGDDE